MKKKKHNKLFMFSTLQHNLPLNFSHPWQLIHNKKINLWKNFLVFKTSSPHMFRLLRPLHIKNITVYKLSITQDHFSTTHYSGNPLYMSQSKASLGRLSLPNHEHISRHQPYHAGYQDVLPNQHSLTIRSYISRGPVAPTLDMQHFLLFVSSTNYTYNKFASQRQFVHPYPNTYSHRWVKVEKLRVLCIHGHIALHAVHVHHHLHHLLQGHFVVPQNFIQFNESVPYTTVL